jgi:serine/threonine protein phosphatase 1
MTALPQQLHLHLPANMVGRDYIVGDLHGCLDLLQAELARIEFDPARDRLFSVGDMIDRGPDSLGCLRLLKEPWFFSVRGNHEELLLAYMDWQAGPDAWHQTNPGKTSPNYLFMNTGGSWARKLAGQDKQELENLLLPRVRALPYLITVGDRDARFHIVHAELVLREPFGEMSRSPDDVTDVILTDDEMKPDMLSNMKDGMLWGDRLITKFGSKRATRYQTPYGELLASKTPMYPGLSLTYVGHNIAPELVLEQSHLFIDRGAYMRNPDYSRLLVLRHDEVRTWLV